VIANEIKAAVILPDGYDVAISEQGEGVMVVNMIDEMAFFISPLDIRADQHVKVAKEMLPHLIMASPARGNC
jgi:hypothetical protein